MDKEEKMNHLVYVDPALLNQSPLKRATFVKELNESWVIQSEASTTGNVDEYEQLAEEKALERFPELKELFVLELDANISFIRGKNSEKWFDFHMN